MGVKILHISDVHGDRYYIGSIGSVIKNVDVVIVSGDFEDPEILDVLNNYGRPVYAVMGNMDPYGIRSRVQKYLIEGAYNTHWVILPSWLPNQYGGG